MRFILVILAIAVAGCGEKTPAEELDGTWDTAAGSCALSAEFSGGARYTLSYGCLLQSGVFGDQVETGSYRADGRTLTTVPDTASCPSQSTPEAVPYVLNGDTLSIALSGGSAVLLTRDTSAGGAGGVTIEFGCLAGSTFTPGQIVNL